MIDAYDTGAFTISPRVHNHLMDEDVVVTRDIPVCGFIPRQLLALVVACLVVQYFLVARGA